MSEFHELLPLIRKKVGSFLYPYGAFPDDEYEQEEGYESDYFTPDSDDPMGDRYRTVAVASAEKLVPLFLDLCELLPESVQVVLERASEDVYTERDVFLSESRVDRGQLMEVFQAYEFTLTEDGMLGIGAFSYDAPLEIFMADHKEIVVFSPELGPVTDVLIHHGLKSRKLEFFYERSHTHLALTEYRGLRGPQFDYLHVADALRHVFGLQLQQDEEQNVDDEGNPLGLVAWRAIVVLASNRRARAGRRSNRSFVQDFFLTAESRREARELLEQRLERDGFILQSLDELFRIDAQQLPVHVRPSQESLARPGIWYVGDKTETDVHWH
ncbi:MAG: hypothetical protein ACE5G2_08965 [Candidatus Krumholzibacteriia bacterium]